MNKSLFRSIFSLVAVLVLGTGVTYALFQSNTVTISNNQLASGTANIKLCYTAGADTWKNSISPSLSIANLVPGGPGSELTDGKDIYLGNDDGNLGNNVPSHCLTYGDTAGSSDVDLSITPSVVIGTCAASDKFKLAFALDSNVPGSGDYKTINDWVSTPSALSDIFSVDESHEVKIYAALDSTATAQNQTCGFDVTFGGNQPV